MTLDWNSELDKVEEATKPIAEGTHTFTITTAVPTRAKESGNQMIKLTVRVEGGPDNGKVAYPNIVFPFPNPKAMKMTLKRLAGLGISEAQLRGENLSVEQIAGRLIGRTFVGTVSHRMYNGEKVSEVDFLNSTPTVGSTPAPAPGPTSAPVPPPTPNLTAEVPPIPTIPTEEPF